MKSYKNKYASEELVDINLRNAIKNYRLTLGFLIGFIALAVFCGFMVSYPEVLIGKFYIISDNQANVVYSPNDGEIQFIVNENDQVSKNDVLAIIGSTTNNKDLIKLKSQLETFDLKSIDSSILNFKELRNYKLGDIEKNYLSFVLAIIEYRGIKEIGVFDQRIKGLKKAIQRNNKKLTFEKFGKSIISEKSKIAANEYVIDSVLFSKNAILSNEVKESKIRLLDINTRELETEKQQQNLKNENDEIFDEIQLLTKQNEKEIRNSLFNIKKAYLQLITEIDLWEQNYVVKSPISGKVEFYLPFFNSFQFVKRNSPLFVILPKVKSLKGKGVFSADGYGKIYLNDSVVIKLRDFPYKEFGSLRGVVQNKSKVFQDSIYYVDIKLTDGLNTSFGKTLDYTYNMSGDVEYSTKKRSIVQRIFSEIQNSISE